MEGYPRELEVQRLVNVASAFQWEKVKEEMIGEELQVTFKKKIVEPEEVTSVSPS